jgi:CubicO group peptidase (beta-lactamase class C family)
MAGLRASVLADVFNRNHYATVNEAVASFADDSLMAAPGSQVIYSNAGYTLLACALEGASGMLFDEFLARRVLGPARMNQTKVDNPFAVIPGRAKAYMLRTTANTEQWRGLWQPRHLTSTQPGTVFNADPVDPTWSPGAGGYLSTPTDLVRFALTLLAGKLLPDSLVAESPQPLRLPNGTIVNRRLGWLVDLDPQGSIFHVFGSDWNGSSSLLVIPNKRMAVAVSTNKGFEQPGALVDSLVQIWSQPRRRP